MNNRDNLKRVDLVVSIWIDPEGDPEEVVENLDYEFRHPDIKDMEIVDAVWEENLN